MGFLKKLMRSDKPEDEPEDPEWEELKKFRNDQKRLLGGGSSGKGDEEDEEPSDPESSDSDEEEKEEEISAPPRPPAPIVQPPDEYQCTDCNLKFKESWNRCPKCGGNVEPIGLDKIDDAKKLYPPEAQETGSQPGGQPIPKKSVAKVRPGAGKRPVRTVKKVKRPSITGTQDGKGQPRKDQFSKSREGNDQRPPNVRSVVKSQDDIDDLFSDDPLLDDFSTADKKKTTRRKVSWKNVPPIPETASASRTPEHTPPPQIRSMLNELMDMDTPAKDSVGDGNCPQCGHVNPPGEWDFCMKCGYRMKK